jgi:hypothetical protein
MYLNGSRFFPEEPEPHTGHPEQLFVYDRSSPFLISATKKVRSEVDHSMADGLLVFPAMYHEMLHPHHCGVCSPMNVLSTVKSPKLLGSSGSSIHSDGALNHTARSSASKRVPCHLELSVTGRCGRKSRNHFVRPSKAFRIREALWSGLRSSRLFGDWLGDKAARSSVSESPGSLTCSSATLPDRLYRHTFE